MKLTIDIPEEQYNDIVKHLTDNDGNYAYSDFNLREIIRNGTPYNPTGDCISREALKEQINATDFDFGDYYDNTEEIRKRVCEAIDNAQSIEPSCKLAVNVNFDEDKLKEMVHTEVADKITMDCQNCGYYEFTRKFASGIVEIMGKYGITSIEELAQELKGGEDK